MKKTNKLNKATKSTVDKDMAHALSLFNRKGVKVKPVKSSYPMRDLTDEDLAKIPDENGDL